jgi:hypothetical protein
MIASMIVISPKDRPNASDILMHLKVIYVKHTSGLKKRTLSNVSSIQNIDQSTTSTSNTTTSKEEDEPVTVFSLHALKFMTNQSAKKKPVLNKKCSLSQITDMFEDLVIHKENKRYTKCQKIGTFVHNNNNKHTLLFANLFDISFLL